MVLNMCIVYVLLFYVEMYCQIAFEQYLSEDNPDYPIELPSPLPPSPQLGRKGKDYLSELQVCADTRTHTID